MTANTFGIHQCTVSKTIIKVSNAINSIMGPQFLHLPKSVNDMQETVSEFEQKLFGIIQAFGCIDGTRIQIKRPTENSRDYFCYKQYFSLNIQDIDCIDLLTLTVDGQGRFMMRKVLQTLLSRENLGKVL